MEIDVASMEGTAYSDLMESLGSDATKYVYRGNLASFMAAVPDGVFVKYAGAPPKSRGIEDVCEAFVGLARSNPDAAKAAVRSYVKGLKGLVERGKMSPNTVPNKIKPVKALLAASEIDVSWRVINKMMPPPVKSRDRAYTREELQAMLAGSSSLTDKVIVLLFSSGGFRIGAWDYFCWEDLAPVGDPPEGAALRVYRGYPEEYWTFVTPEAHGAMGLYRKEWKYRFGDEPRGGDPLLASVRYDRPVRINARGVKARVTKIVARAGLRPPGEGRRMHAVKLDHGFRKYFNTMLRRAKVNYLDKEDMMGHKVGLESHYERYNEEDFERFPEYKKAIPFLTVSDEERLRIEAAAKQARIDELTALRRKEAEGREKIRSLKKQAVGERELRGRVFEMIEEFMSRTPGGRPCARCGAAHEGECSGGVPG